MKRIFIGMLVCSVMGCTTVYNPATERKETYFIDEQTEVSIGRNLAQQVASDKKLVTDASAVSYVRRVGKNIASVSDRNYLDYHFYILADKEMNAFSLPGGFVFVNSGLLSGITEDELAFVLGHEIGHIAARHSIKRLQAQLGMNILLSLALKDTDSSLMEAASDIVYNAVSLGFSRKDEYLADSLAVRYAYKAGYNPGAGVSLLQKLAKTGGESHYLVFLRSHPEEEKRIAHIKEVMAQYH